MNSHQRRVHRRKYQRISQRFTKLVQVQTGLDTAYSNFNKIIAGVGPAGRTHRWQQSSDKSE